MKAINSQIIDFPKIQIILNQSEFPSLWFIFTTNSENLVEFRVQKVVFLVVPRGGRSGEHPGHLPRIFQTCLNQIQIPIGLSSVKVG